MTYYRSDDSAGGEEELKRVDVSKLKELQEVVRNVPPPEIAMISSRVTCMVHPPLVSQPHVSQPHVSQSCGFLQWSRSPTLVPFVLNCARQCSWTTASPVSTSLVLRMRVTCQCGCRRCKRLWYLTGTHPSPQLMY